MVKCLGAPEMAVTSTPAANECDGGRQRSYPLPAGSIG
jgi:hypothetical protein